MHTGYPQLPMVGALYACGIKHFETIDHRVGLLYDVVILGTDNV